MHSCTSRSKRDSFSFLFLPLLSWTSLTGRRDIPWHVTLPHTLPSCLLCVVSTSHHLFYPFKAIFMAEEVGEYITPPTGRAAVPVTSHSPHLLQGFFFLSEQREFGKSALHKLSWWPPVSGKRISHFPVVTLLFFVCFVQTCTHARQEKKKKSKKQTIPAPTCTNADTLWSWLHNSTGLFCSLVSQTDGLLCPQLCWTNEAWLEICVRFTLICQQMTVTHPQITSVFMEWVTASCFSCGHDCWSRVCRTTPSLHTRTWRCRDESCCYVDLTFFVVVILN